MSSRKAARPKAPAKKRDSVADRHGDAMNVLSIYRLIVEEVIRKSKEEMTQDSHTEQVLQHLQDSWWSKVEEALVVKPPPTPSSYIATYPDTPSTFYPPEVLTTVNTTPYRGAPLPGVASVIPGGIHDLTEYRGAPAPTMEPVSHAPPHSFFPPTTTTTSSSSTSSRIVVPTAHRFPNPQLRQTDGTNDNDPESRLAEGEQEEREISSLNKDGIDRLFLTRLKEMRNEKGRKGIDKRKEGGAGEDEELLQVDGKNDRGKSLQNQDFYDSGGSSSERDDDELNSDDDDSDLNSEDDEPGNQEPETNHIILCQYEKVSRVKNKRKCVMTRGVMRLNGQDYLFQKGNGEIDF